MSRTRGWFFALFAALVLWAAMIALGSAVYEAWTSAPHGVMDQ